MENNIVETKDRIVGRGVFVYMSADASVNRFVAALLAGRGSSCACAGGADSARKRQPITGGLARAGLSCMARRSRPKTASKETKCTRQMG